MNLRAGIHRYFNPRSPWGERRYLAQRSAPSPPFQSTLPVGGATGVVPKVSQQALFQSTLPVEGSDSTYVTADATYTAFQSTLPVRGATAKIHKKGYAFSAKNIIFTADSCFRMIQLNENVRYLTQSAVKIGANLLENSVCFRFAD